MTKKSMLMEQELVIQIHKADRTLRERLDALSLDQPPVAAPSNSPAIDNLIDNSDWSWSTAAYTTAGITPATAGDSNNRAHNWYRMQRATALLVENDANSLKGSGHSLFGGETNDTPRWSKTDGWAELGETGATAWDICCPLPNNFVTPGMRFYIQMLARLRTATALPGALKFFWSLYDNTNSAPAPQIIKGTAFALDGETYGPVGATTRAYKLIVTTDYGNQVESTVKTITDTPAVLTPANGVALTWPRYPGFTRVDIYVTEGGADLLVGIIGNGASAFNDVGQRLGPVDSVPSVTDTAAKAYTETRSFTPTLDWAQWDFSIITPQTYNFSLTTGKQWLRGGVIGLMGDGHQLEIDRIGVSTGFGVWSLSGHDKSALSPPSTTQTSSSQGPPSGGGDPPVDGEGDPHCSTLDTLIQVCDRNGENECDIPIEQISRGDFLVRRNGGLPNRVKKIKPGWSDAIITIETENGAGRRCSPSDRWLVVGESPSGTAARRLCEGMEVVTRKNGSVQTAKIVRYSVSVDCGEEVRILELENETPSGTDDDHIYFAGDAAAHNIKTLP